MVKRKNSTGSIMVNKRKYLELIIKESSELSDKTTTEIYVRIFILTT